MPFKINISHNGKTFKLETDSEAVVGKSIGETIKGQHISSDLEGYELLIKGTSDISGSPGKQGLEGAGYHRKLLTKGFGMKNPRKGIRLRKTLRGQEISLRTSQINMIVVKEGRKKFEELLPKKEANSEERKEENKAAEEKKEEKAEEKKKEEITKKPAEKTETPAQ